MVSTFNSEVRLSTATWTSTGITAEDLSIMSAASDTLVTGAKRDTLRTLARYAPDGGFDIEKVSPEAALAIEEDTQESAVARIIDTIDYFLKNTGSSLIRIKTNERSKTYDTIVNSSKENYLFHASEIYDDPSFQWLLKQYSILAILVNLLHVCFSVFNLYRGDSAAFKEYFYGLIKASIMTLLPVIILILYINIAFSPLLLKIYVKKIIIINKKSTFLVKLLDKI